MLVENPGLVNQLGGDQRMMTAYFSDVASFSAISENLTPVELVELLNEYLTEMCDIIAQHDGTIDKFEGDAVVAFWGAPIKMEDHARCAVLATIDMQNKIHEMREHAKAMTPPLAIAAICLGTFVGLVALAERPEEDYVAHAAARESR